jgi:ABC-type nickel/cobalt efflux system permease component RcnA
MPLTRLLHASYTPLTRTLSAFLCCIFCFVVIFFATSAFEMVPLFSWTGLRAGMCVRVSSESPLQMLIVCFVCWAVEFKWHYLYAHTHTHTQTHKHKHTHKHTHTQAHTHLQFDAHSILSMERTICSNSSKDNSPDLSTSTFLYFKIILYQANSLKTSQRQP